MKIKCVSCKVKKIDFDPKNAPVCITCFPKYANEYIKSQGIELTCEEKGHSRLCKCPENPLNKKLEHDANEYVSPVVTAADFPQPGLKVDEFLKTIENEKDKAKLKAFFDRHR